MKSFVIGVAMFLSAVPAWGSHCRARVKVKAFREKVLLVREKATVINNYYYPPNAAVVYPAPVPVAMNASVVQPVYQAAAKAAVCCVPVCCPTVVAPGSAIPPGQHPAPQPDGPSNPPAGAAELDEQAQAIFTRECVSCHSGSNPKTALDLRDVSKLTAEQCKDTSLRVMLGEMPPQNAAEKVSDEEAQLLMKWAKAK